MFRQEIDQYIIENVNGPILKLGRDLGKEK